jgi:hypothetical protein
MVGENAKMLCEQIEEENGKITRMFLDEETEISFWTRDTQKSYNKNR